MQLADPESNREVMWMAKALELARQAEAIGEVPVGAVIVLNDQIIGEGWNQPISSNDPSAHAEVIALRDAGNKINNYRLVNATMYVTLEPCLMCAGALIHARIARLVYAVADPKSGACGSMFNLLDTDKLNHKVEIRKGVREDECRSLIRDFFKEKRT